mmetsp:Transcript_47105/g.94924  ORF Transcript_47105/g.94924 Transcript_47105/m.94924 type:complete len:135 (-) Transcript_47105:288-692(-)
MQLSSLPLQITLYFNTYFLIGYLVSSVAIFVYKYDRLFYPNNSFLWDVSLLALYGINESVRISFAMRGNKTESIDPLLKGTILSGVACVGYVYFLQLQTWILQVDLVLNSIGLVFVGVEFVLSVNSILQFYFDV